MAAPEKKYPDDHWLKSRDPQIALEAYLDQQKKAYSKVKNAFIQELLGDLKGKRVLDYGCGAGFFTVYAALNGAAHVVGVDSEETALATARHFAGIEGVERLCSFVQGRRLPSSLGTSSFDVILMKDVIEHVEDDQSLLDSAAKAVAPTGSIVLSTQNSLSLNYLVQGSYHRLWLGDRDWFGWDPTHLRFYSPMSLSGKLKAAGFETVGWRSVYIIPYKYPAPSFSKKRFLRLDALSWIDRRLGGVFPYNRLGWNIVVKARVSPLVTVKTRLGREMEKVAPITAAVATRNSARHGFLCE